MYKAKYNLLPICNQMLEIKQSQYEFKQTQGERI